LDNPVYEVFIPSIYSSHSIGASSALIPKVSGIQNTFTPCMANPKWITEKNSSPDLTNKTKHSLFLTSSYQKACHLYNVFSKTIPMKKAPIQ
tara:strand:+ start:738 stop:1013 length:276 start_codon:yes stop_codon:yes gene_type:complete